MAENFTNIHKTIKAFDAHQTGYIELDDLRSVLNSFTVTLAETTFYNLMNRFHLKSSGKVDWRKFLWKFQPAAVNFNGGTVPINPNHR